MQAKHSSRNGFSFIEMTIAMLVMAILAAIATPSYLTAIAHYRATLSAQRIVADLHYARSEAERESKNRAVHFDMPNNLYRLINSNDINDSSKSYVVNLVDDPFSADLVSASFDGDANVIFDRFGRPDSGGTVVVRSGDVLQTITLATDGTATRL